MVRHQARVDVFQAIADPTRRRILDLLGAGDRTVSEIASPFRISQPGVSQHLRVLRDANLVRQKRVGRYRRYRLNAAALRQVYDWVAHYDRFWDEKLKALGKYMENKSHATHHS